jgi:hypothetical protein
MPEREIFYPFLFGTQWAGRQLTARRAKAIRAPRKGQQ